jgi:hypothetical protein
MQECYLGNKLGATPELSVQGNRASSWDCAKAAVVGSRSSHLSPETRDK